MLEIVKRIIIGVLMFMLPTLVIGLMIWFLNPEMSYRLSSRVMWECDSNALIGVLHFFYVIGLVAWLTNPETEI